jgi:nitrate/nitrite transport system substrate-binding protein
MNHCSRRKFMLTAGAATAGILTHGCTLNSPVRISQVAPAMGRSLSDVPETSAASLGFIALTDAAPLIVAQEKIRHDGCAARATALLGGCPEQS